MQAYGAGRHAVREALRPAHRGRPHLAPPARGLHRRGPRDRSCTSCSAWPRSRRSSTTRPTPSAAGRPPRPGSRPTCRPRRRCCAARRARPRSASSSLRFAVGLVDCPLCHTRVYVRPESRAVARHRRHPADHLCRPDRRRPTAGCTPRSTDFEILGQPRARGLGRDPEGEQRAPRRSPRSAATPTPAAGSSRCRWRRATPRRATPSASSCGASARIHPGDGPEGILYPDNVIPWSRVAATRSVTMAPARKVIVTCAVTGSIAHAVDVAAPAGDAPARSPRPAIGAAQGRRIAIVHLHARDPVRRPTRRRTRRSSRSSCPAIMQAVRRGHQHHHRRCGHR
jgi:hypothetical protein